MCDCGTEENSFGHSQWSFAFRRDGKQMELAKCNTLEVHFLLHLNHKSKENRQ